MLYAGYVADGFKKAAERRTQDQMVLESLATGFEQHLEFSNQVLKQRDALYAGCAKGEAAQDASSCLDFYLAILDELDIAVNSLSWRLDVSPVSTDAYASFDKFKNRYWDSCLDSEPDDRCGWRQLILRSVYGIGPPREDGKARCQLRACVGDARLGGPCHDEIRRLSTAVADPMGDRANQFSCFIAKNSNALRESVFANRATAEAASAYVELHSRLQKNARGSVCARIRGEIGGGTPAQVRR